MATLYEISDKLLSIFNNVESNDGEISEEDLNELEITKDQLNEKLSSYKRAILNWESDIDACKNEEKRIKENRKIKENRIERLKDYMLDAILQFGYDGKSNNKYYDLPDGKIFTRNTDEVIFDEDRINFLIKLCCDIIANYEDDGKSILEKINYAKNIYKEDEPDYTEDDLKYIVLKFEDVLSIEKLFTIYLPIIQYYQKEFDYQTPLQLLTNATSKSLSKVLLKSNEANVTFMYLKNNKSLVIK